MYLSLHTYISVYAHKESGRKEKMLTLVVCDSCNYGYLLLSSFCLYLAARFLHWTSFRQGKKLLNINNQDFFTPTRTVTPPTGDVFIEALATSTASNSMALLISISHASLDLGPLFLPPKAISMILPKLIDQCFSNFNIQVAIWLLLKFRFGFRRSVWAWPWDPTALMWP